MSERGAVVAAAIATPVGNVPFRGERLAAISEAGPSGVAWDSDGTITFAGPAGQLPWEPSAGSPDRGCLVPGFVDCHTHLPFVGWRADEFESRLQGATYRDLHGREGGIYRSSRMFREASDDEVLAFCRPLLDEMATLGTTALELKTGYGLSIEQELRQARLARRLAEDAPQTCRVTLLACHAVPPDMDRMAWVSRACDELIPAAGEGLADQVDIYVEDIAFSLDDLERVAEAAAAAGLPLRVHADQLGATGAAAAAVRLGARSADHLNHCGQEGVEALGHAPVTTAVLLPTSTFLLGAASPPVADLRAAGSAVAIATDFNPGTSPVSSIPLAVSMASTLYGLPPLESLTSVTANPAWVLGLDDRLGMLRPGLRADVVLLDAPSFAHVAYRPGHDPVAGVWIAGEPVVVK
jgi:imidazolonepropionase